MRPIRLVRTKRSCWPSTRRVRQRGRGLRRASSGASARKHSTSSSSPRRSSSTISCATNMLRLPARATAVDPDLRDRREALEHQRVLVGRTRSREGARGTSDPARRAAGGCARSSCPADARAGADGARCLGLERTGEVDLVRRDVGARPSSTPARTSVIGYAARGLAHAALSRRRREAADRPAPTPPACRRTGPRSRPRASASPRVRP